jgi:UDPglucose--hexose-1-phosphate uridylyltransferase
MIHWEKQPHRRLNPLTREWVLVSANRTLRPWQGQIERQPAISHAAYDPACYLCPGNARAGGQRNLHYTGVFAFENDFPVLVPVMEPDIEPEALGDDGAQRALLVAEKERGVCRVLCFSPDHSLSLSRMSTENIRGVVDAWCLESRQLGSLPFINYVQIFENRGPMAGASNPHPHCQIWANETIPNEIAKEDHSQERYLNERDSCLLCDYASIERNGVRMVYENDGFAVVVPFWAVWPFETLLIARRHIGNLHGLKDRERLALADALKQITTRYDRLFETEFPYSMGIHQEPSDGNDHAAWHLHVHFLPPLLRSATVRKFMVGYELLAMPQRDLTAESAAEQLRRLNLPP